MFLAVVSRIMTSRVYGSDPREAEPSVLVGADSATVGHNKGCKQQKI